MSPFGQSWLQNYIIDSGFNCIRLALASILAQALIILALVHTRIWTIPTTLGTPHPATVPLQTVYCTAAAGPQLGTIGPWGSIWSHSRDILWACSASLEPFKAI